METLYYDTNFVNNQFNQQNLKNMIEFLVKHDIDIEVEIIKQMIFENFNIEVYNNIYYWETSEKEYFTETLIINKDNYDQVLDNNIIFTFWVKFTKNIFLKWKFSIEQDDSWEIYNCIKFFYTLSDESIMIDNLFFYIWETFYRFLEIFNPEIISMWEATIPVTKLDILHWNIWGQFLYLNKTIIHLKNFQEYEIDLVYQKLQNGYLFSSLLNKDELLIKMIDS